MAVGRSPRRIASCSSSRMARRRGDVAGPDLARDLAGDRRLDQFAALEYVVSVGDRRRRDEGAAIARDRHDMIMGERLQSAAHDGAADAEHRAELLFGEFRARRQSMFDDGLDARCDRRSRPGRRRRWRRVAAAAVLFVPRGKSQSQTLRNARLFIVAASLSRIFGGRQLNLYTITLKL